MANRLSNLRSLATSPPPSWSLERKLEYVAWSRGAVANARGVNAELEAAFDAAAAEAERVLSSPLAIDRDAGDCSLMLMLMLMLMLKREG